MVRRHPHVIKYQFTTQSEPTRNDDGDLIPGAETTVSKVEVCRVQPNIRGSYIISEVDGQKIEFNSTVYLGVSSDPIPVGQQVEIFDEGDKLILSGTIKRFHPGQIQARAWI